MSIGLAFGILKKGHFRIPTGHSKPGFGPFASFGRALNQVLPDSPGPRVGAGSGYDSK